MKFTSKGSKCLLLAGAIVGACALSGCAKKNSAPTVRYLNFKPEVASVYQELAASYEKGCVLFAEAFQLKTLFGYRCAVEVLQIAREANYLDAEEKCVDCEKQIREIQSEAYRHATRLWDTAKKKKERCSVGPPTLANASFLFSEVYNKKVGEAGFEPT